MEIECVRVEIAKLELQPGDTLIFKVPAHAYASAVENIARMVEPILPEGTRLLVIDDATELSVIKTGVEPGGERG
jgi:hypothetical protein